MFAVFFCLCYAPCTTVILPCGHALSLPGALPILPGLVRDDLRDYAQRARDVCEDFGASLLVNADIALAREMGVGVHRRAAQLAAVATRPLPAQSPVAASCHNAQELAQAQALGVEFVVIGPVLKTA